MIIEDSMILNNSATKFGGGIVNAQGYLRLTDSIVDGNLAGSNDYYTGGAGVASLTYLPSGNDAFETVIQRSTISNNILSGNSFPYGSGIYASGYGSFTMSNSTVSGNSALGSASRGGGALFYGYIASPGIMSVSISETTFDNNYAEDSGGGLAVRGREDTSVRLELTGVDFTSNRAPVGGTIFNWSPRSAGADDARITLVDSNITGNTATSEGIFENLTGGQMTLRNANVSGNSSGQAVLYNQGFDLSYGYFLPEFVLENSTVANNISTGYAAAVSIYDGSTTILQSTISGNSAPGVGTFYIRTTYTYVGTPMEGFTNILQSTITNNTAYVGGGLYVNQYSTVNLSDSIISGNSASASPDIYTQAGGTVTAGYSLIGDNTGSGLAVGNPDPYGNLVGDSVTPINAMLSPLGSYGGNTLTHVPLAGSPAIDTGDPAVVGGTDQRGFARVVNGRVDMGSTEFGATGSTCDLDGDGDCDIDDLDILCAEIFAGTRPSSDLDVWLADASPFANPYLKGDANLDGIVDGQDFITWNTFKFTPSGGLWSRADFNCDGLTDGQDFIIWNTFKFMSSTVQQNSNATPELAGRRGLPGGKSIHAERTGAAWLDRVTQSSPNVQLLQGVQASSTGLQGPASVQPLQPDAQRPQPAAVNLSAHQVQSFAETAHRRASHEAIDSIFADLN